MGADTLTDVAVIIPAAGSGFRFSSSSSQQKIPDAPNGTTTISESFAVYARPKQYLPVGDVGHSTPLLVHTVDAFSKIPWISRILILVQEGNVESTKSLIGHYGSRTSMLKSLVALGGPTRHLSIQMGVKEVQSFNPTPSLVVVHDAVRPFVDETVCHTVCEAARKFGAAGVFAPVVSTILRISPDGFMNEALPRHDLYASEMPQAFHFPNLQQAYRLATTDELETGTECLALVQKYAKCQVKMIPIDPNKYFKVTYEKDLLAVNAMIAAQVDRRAVSRNSSSEDFVRDARQAHSGMSRNASSEDFLRDARQAPTSSSAQLDYP